MAALQEFRSARSAEEWRKFQLQTPDGADAGTHLDLVTGRRYLADESADVTEDDLVLRRAARNV